MYLRGFFFLEPPRFFVDFLRDFLRDLYTLLRAVCLTLANDGVLFPAFLSAFRLALAILAFVLNIWALISDGETGRILTPSIFFWTERFLLFIDLL